MIPKEILREAVDIIKSWHNLDLLGRLSDEEIDAAWKIYYDHAPEMRGIREALEEKT